MPLNQDFETDILYFLYRNLKTHSDQLYNSFETDKTLIETKKH